MRTTAEVIEAARLGEPCTEEELRLAIVSMRQTMVFAHSDHAHWSLDERLPIGVRLKSKAHWNSVNKGWHVPLDKRIDPMDRPGHPSLAPRKRLAERVWKKATGEGDA
jgi:hypothetical protein